MRGEYQVQGGGLFITWELPPRARRIRNCVPSFSNPVGTTSACAENTGLVGHDISLGWNYLRVRGEYAVRVYADPETGELPPRARRIRAQFS